MSNTMFTIGLRLDSSQMSSSLKKIRSELQDAFTLKGTGIDKGLQPAIQSAKLLERTLEKATTGKGVSFAAFNAELKKAGISASQLTANLAKGGAHFQQSLMAANTVLATTNRQVLVLNKHFAEIGRVLKQSFKYTVAQTLWREIAGQAREAVRWVTDLNDAMNDIAVVTGKTSEQMKKITEYAVKGSRELRVAAKDYAEGALIFYQQGLNDEEVTRRNEITIKAAKAAGQSIEQMSSQLTAIWNTYSMIGDQQMKAASVGAKMASSTAVSFKDIAEAMQTAAAPASQMGVSYNSLAAIISTVGDTTQQTASVIGNAFKTIFSRMEQLKIDGTDGTITLKAMSQQLAAMGISIEDANGNLLKLDDVISQVGEKWQTWTEKQKLAVAEVVGGTRQYGQFLALMNNYDKYLGLLKEANVETGETLEQQYTQALDSIQSRAENAAEAWHRAFARAFESDSIKTFYSLVEGLGNLFSGIVSGVGGLPGI